MRLCVTSQDRADEGLEGEHTILHPASRAAIALVGLWPTYSVTSHSRIQCQPNRFSTALPVWCTDAQGSVESGLQGGVSNCINMLRGLLLFFILSRTSGILLLPATFLIGAGVLGAILMATRLASLGRKFMIASFALLAFCGLRRSEAGCFIH